MSRCEPGALSALPSPGESRAAGAGPGAPSAGGAAELQEEPWAGAAVRSGRAPVGPARLTVGTRVTPWSFLFSVGIFLLFFTSNNVSSIVNSNSDFPWQHLWLNKSSHPLIFYWQLSVKAASLHKQKWSDFWLRRCKIGPSLYIRYVLSLFSNLITLQHWFRKKKVHALHLESPRRVHHQSLESWRVSISIYLSLRVKKVIFFTERDT